MHINNCIHTLDMVPSSLSLFHSVVVVTEVGNIIFPENMLEYFGDGQLNLPSREAICD